MTAGSTNHLQLQMPLPGIQPPAAAAVPQAPIQQAVTAPQQAAIASTQQQAAVQPHTPHVPQTVAPPTPAPPATQPTARVPKAPAAPTQQQTAAPTPPKEPAEPPPPLTGWRRSASNAPTLIKNLQRLRSEICYEYPIRDIVVLGMGGSALGVRVLADLYSHELLQQGVRLRVVDTTEPVTIQAILRDFNVRQGLVIVSSKSGGTIEPLCLGQIFFQHLSSNLGSPAAAAAHFIAVSDEGTPLSALAQSQAWRGIINTPKNVGGRFSVLTAFGLAPLVLAGVNPEEVIAAAQNMEFMCIESELNPADKLADSIYQNLMDGRNKLIIGHDPQSKSFARWLEQLIAESLGKEGKGIIPLPMPTRRANKLLALGHSDIQNVAFANLSRRDVGEDLLRWMFATEKLAEYLELDPFDQPNVEAVKRATHSAIQGNTAHSRGGDTFGQDRLHRVLADTRIAPPTQLPLLIGPDNFIVLMSWAPANAQHAASLEDLAESFEDRYHRPVVIAEGPHYLHSSGQLYKGGPNLGVYLLLTKDTPIDMPIPRAHYSLRQLYRAALSGDLEVMLSLGKPMVRL